MAKGTRTTTLEQRQRAGHFLKQRREELGITQLAVWAAVIPKKWPTMVSQMEVGKGRVPPDRYVDYARVLKMEPKDFCRELLRYYDPEMWKILFGGHR